MDIKTLTAEIANSTTSLQNLNQEELNEYVSEFQKIGTDDEKKEILIKLLDSLSEDELKKDNYRVFFNNDNVLPYVKQLIEVAN